MAGYQADPAKRAIALAETQALRTEALAKALAKNTSEACLTAMLEAVYKAWWFQPSHPGRVFRFDFHIARSLRLGSWVGTTQNSQEI